MKENLEELVKELIAIDKETMKKIEELKGLMKKDKVFYIA